MSRKLTRPLLHSLVFALVFALPCGPVLAADTEPPPPRAARPAAADPLAAARGLIAAKDWGGALTELKRVNASSNADWNNLMGFASRKQATPDLEAAQRHYDTALRIDPRHQGALEYSGELALIKGDVATAEARLVTLSRLCSSPCVALDTLKASITSYRAGGKPAY